MKHVRKFLIKQHDSEIFLLEFTHFTTRSNIVEMRAKGIPDFMADAELNFKRESGDLYIKAYDLNEINK